MEKIKLNYSILVSINKETILKICNAETTIVSFLMGENFRHLPISHITKNEQALFLSFRRELVRFVFYGFSLLFKTRDTHRDFLVYRL